MASSKRYTGQCTKKENLRKIIKTSDNVCIVSSRYWERQKERNLNLFIASFKLYTDRTMHIKIQQIARHLNPKVQWMSEQIIKILLIYTTPRTEGKKIILVVNPFKDVFPIILPIDIIKGNYP